MWILPAKWHAILLLVFYGGAAPVLILSTMIRNATIAWWVMGAWLIMLVVLNFTPCRGEKFSEQDWIV